MKNNFIRKFCVLNSLVIHVSRSPKGRASQVQEWSLRKLNDWKDQKASSSVVGGEIGMVGLRRAGQMSNRHPTLTSSASTDMYTLG